MSNTQKQLDYVGLKDQVEEILLSQSPIVDQYFQKLSHNDVSFKKHQSDIVTIADRKIEAKLKQQLSQLPLEAGFFGEESGKADSDRDFCWIVDPIDGTKHFAAGLPMFGLAVSLTLRTKPVLGVIFFPALSQQILSAVSGQGAWLNGEKLIPLDGVSIEISSLYVDLDDFKNLESTELAWVDQKLLQLHHRFYRIRHFGSSGLAVLMMAKGLLHGFVDLTGRNPVWDMAAQRVIMTEMGAREEFIAAPFGPERYVAGVGESFNQLKEIVFEK